MKRSMLIKVLCLLLSISIPTTSVASAQTLLYTYPSLQAELREGITTNEMAYVDQFFNEDGSFSVTGDELLHWLKMTPIGTKPTTEYLRINSGYLMLEQEIEHQATSGIYDIGSRYVKGARLALETVGSFGINFQEKFPGAGASAYIYYNYLYQIYFNYINALQTKIEEVDNTLKEVADALNELTELTPEMLVSADRAYVNAKLAVAQYKHSNAFAIVPDKIVGGKISIFDIVDIKYKTTVDLDGIEHRYGVTFVTQTPSGTVERGIDELLAPTLKGEGVVCNTTKLRTKLLGRMSNSQIDGLFEQELASIWDVDATGNLEFPKLSAAHAEGCLKGVRYMDGYDELSGQLKHAFDVAESRALKTAVSRNRQRVHKSAEKTASVDTIGKITDLAGSIMETYGYFSSVNNTTIH